MKALSKFPPIGFKGDYIDGGFRFHTNPDFQFEGKSPAEKSDTIGIVNCSYHSAEESAQAAARASRQWELSELDDRKAFIQNFLELLENHSQEFIQLISREVGKPRWESSLEVNTTIERTKQCLAECSIDGAERKYTHLFIAGASQKFAHTLGVSRIKPRGVALVLSHYNSPCENAISYIIPALLAGNTVVYKPSKKTPGVGQLISSCMHQANFPPGVFNLVQGGREMARRLVQQVDFDTVFYAGDFEFAKQLRKDTIEHSEKLLVLETGGKNPAIVLADADFDYALKEVLIGTYLTAGQRAESTSRLILQEDIAEKFLTRFHQSAKKIVVGNPFDEVRQPFMGPLVDKKTLDRYLTFQGTAVREHAECVMRGKSLTLESDGFYVSPSIYLFKSCDEKKIYDSIYLQTEIFGPTLGVHIVKDWEEAMSVANASNYALSCSVFTRNEQIFRQIWRRLHYGTIHWNEGTTKHSFQMPPTGIKRSFKANPLVQNIQSFVHYAVNSLEIAEPQNQPQDLPPGIVI